MEYTLQMSMVVPKQLKRIQRKLKTQSEEIHSLKEEIVSLKEEVKTLVGVVSKSHSKMDQHVDFVEGVYMSVRHPLDFVKKRIEYFIGNDSSSCSMPLLPQIEGPSEDENLNV
jgi:glycerol-3-phosphate responsive antiterminator